MFLWLKNPKILLKGIVQPFEWLEYTFKLIEKNTNCSITLTKFWIMGNPWTIRSPWRPKGHVEDLKTCPNCPNVPPPRPPCSVESEPVFINLYKAWESIPSLAGRYENPICRTTQRYHQPARLFLGTDTGSLNDYKSCSVESEVGVLNRKIAGSARLVSYGCRSARLHRLGLCSRAGRYEVS